MQSIFLSFRPIFFVLFLAVLFSCNREDAGKPNNPTSTTITDIDGNTYNTLTIGNQVWMKENLKVSRYRNGDPIITDLVDSIWLNTTSGAFSIYNQDTANNSTYGKLYNFYAAVDPRCLCPLGWHVPTNSEWSILESFLGGELLAGGAMKAASPLWVNPNTGATNSSGFSGLPGGYRDGGMTGTDFNSIRFDGIWWSSTGSSTSGRGWWRGLTFRDGGIYFGEILLNYGFSVRCLKD